MRNNRRTLGILIIVLGIAIIALVIYLLFFNPEKEIPQVNPGPDQEQTGGLPSVSENAEDVDISEGDRPREQEYRIEEEEPHVVNEYDVAKLASIFVQRFGSYSNYSNYSNFEDLKIFMTPKMRAWAKDYVASLKASASGADEYYGVTTKAISTKIKNYDKQKALISVSTQRIESGADISEGDAYTQDIEVSLQNVNGSWLVDSAYWQAR